MANLLLQQVEGKLDTLNGLIGVDPTYILQERKGRYAVVMAVCRSSITPLTNLTSLYDILDSIVKVVRLNSQITSSNK